MDEAARTEAHVKQCGKCGYATADAYLCEICSADTVRALSLLAPLVSHLRAAMTDLRAAATDDVRVDGTHEQRLGADMQLSDRSHELYAAAANWCVGWALATGKPAPEHLEQYGRDNAVTGLPGGYLEYLAPGRVASWLIAMHDEITQSPDAGEYAVSITSTIATEARAVGYRATPARVREKLCRTCRSETLRLHWPLGEQPTLRCTACGGEWSCGPVLSRAVLEYQ